MTAQLDVNFFEESLDPFPVYEEIRAAGRVVRNDRLKVWMVPGFDDCTEILTDRGETFAMMNSDPQIVFWFKAPNMIMVDGSEHNRLRYGIAPLFVRSEIMKWEPRVGEVVDRLLQPLLEQPEGFDLIEDFTMIPTVIVAEMLGVPEDRHQDFRRWSHAVTSNLGYGHEDPAVRDEMQRASDEVNEYMQEELERHRKERPDDLLTAMLDIPSLSDEEIVSTAILLLLAGYETTAKVMSNCLIVLEGHPEQRRIVADNASLVPAAVEEVLRWWPLLQASPRYVARDTVFAGTPLRQGDIVYPLLAAANRDPSRWPQPDRFDVRREIKAHMGFGYGPHLCLGAHLARLETRIALEYLLAHAPEYRLRDVYFGKPFMNHGPDRGIVEPHPAGAGVQG
jgi:cytochrome P450